MIVRVSVVAECQTDHAGLRIFDRKDLRIWFVLLRRMRSGEHLDGRALGVRFKPIQLVLDLECGGNATHQIRNAGTIGISLFGGHGSAETDDFSENFTPDQDRALAGLIDKLRAKYGNLALSGHNQYAAKACPGFNVPSWWAGRSQPAETKAQELVARIKALIEETGL